MTAQTRKRKADHIRISLNNDVQAKEKTTGFEDVQFVHRALPEIDRPEISLKAKVFGHVFEAPLIAGAITGGTEEATKINAVIAQAVEELGLGMGVGSQRAALEDKRLEKTFSIVRKRAPNAFLIANIGGVQLVNGYGLKEIERAVEMIDADAIAVHLNALQEIVQLEGQTNFKGILARIAELADKIDKPIIAKETGAGMSAEDASILEKAGVRGIDVSGAGGTSFAAIEYYRALESQQSPHRNRGEIFWDWGIPTVPSIVEASSTVSIPVIASGGVRGGIDAAKALALHSSLASFSHPLLGPAVKNLKETKDSLNRLIEELGDSMFLVGAKSVMDLCEVPLVIMGKTAEWLNARGFDPKNYARRGRR